MSDEEKGVESGVKKGTENKELGVNPKIKSYIKTPDFVWFIIYLIMIIFGICLWFTRGNVNITISNGSNLMLLCAKMICIAFQKFITFIGIIGEVFVFMGIRGKFFTFYATISIIVLAISVLGIIL